MQTDNPLKRRVRLYYLGGLAPDGQENLFVHSRGRPFQVPEVGGYVEMELFYAQDLIQRGHNGVHSVWSLSERDAQMAKSGTLFRDTSKLVDPSALTVEELERLLRERKGEAEAEPKPTNEEFINRLLEIAATDNDEDEPAVDDEPPAAPVEQVVEEAPAAVEEVVAEEPAPARRSTGRQPKASTAKKEEATK